MHENNKTDNTTVPADPHAATTTPELVSAAELMQNEVVGKTITLSAEQIKRLMKMRLTPEQRQAKLKRKLKARSKRRVEKESRRRNR